MVLLVSLRCSAQHILGAAETHRDRGLVFPLLEGRGRWWLPAQGGGGQVGMLGIICGACTQNPRIPQGAEGSTGWGAWRWALLCWL